jgi:hypothetical protein
MVAVISLKAVVVLPIASQSTRADLIVKPPPVNCAWPQLSFESSSSSSKESGLALLTQLSRVMMQGHDITRWFTCFEIGCILHGLEEVGGTGKVSEILSNNLWESGEK